MIEFLLNLAVNNKDVFTTIVTLIFVFVGMIPLFKWFVGQMLKEIHIGFERISESVGKPYLSETDEILELVSKYIQSATSQKMAFLSHRLEQNAIYEDMEGVKRQIKSRLSTFSLDSYIKQLNKKNTKVGLLGDYIIKNYPMDIFLEDLYGYFFHKTYNNSQKLNYIQNTVMPEYLNKFLEQLKNDLNK